MPAKKVTAANINVSLYDGEFSASFDCVSGSVGSCSRARFFAEPPEPEDECAFKHGGGNCSHGPAQRAALIALRDRITEELKQYEMEDGAE